MAKQNLLDFEKWLKTLDKYYQETMQGLSSLKPENLLLSFFGNYLMTWTVVNCMFFVYEMTVEYTDFFMAVQHFWAMLAVAQVSFRGLNRLYHWDEMEDLIKWFRGQYYENKNDAFYNEIIKEQLYKQNKRIEKVMRCEYICGPMLFKTIINYYFRFVTYLMYLGGICYVSAPILFQTGGTPTPVIINGVRETEFRLPFFIMWYCVFLFNGYHVVYSSVCNECFFAITSIVIGHRLSTIATLLKLLDYPGQRDAVKDKRILGDCHLMHLDVLK